jgi:AbrB family looped-hinge helix DNA binding protein
MNEALMLSNRGQITLPAALRKRLGIKAGDFVILEERDDEIVLKPAIVVEVQNYSDAQIIRWDADDALSESERARIMRKVSAAKS